MNQGQQQLTQEELLEQLYLYKKEIGTLQEQVNIQRLFLENSKFEGSDTLQNHYKFNGETNNALDWEIFENNLKIHYGESLTIKNILSNLTGNAETYAISITFITHDAHQLLEQLRARYKKSPSEIKNQFIKFTTNNKYKSIEELTLYFNVVLKSTKMENEEAIEIFKEALGINYIKLLTHHELPKTIQEFIVKINIMEAEHFQHFNESLYKNKKGYETFKDFTIPNSATSTIESSINFIYNSSDLYCSNCNRRGHARYTCFKLVNNNSPSYNNNQHNNNNQNH